MRLRKVKDVDDKIKEYDGLIIFEPEKQKGSWHKLFKNDNPIQMEIGMGKGKFIREMALRNPDINFVGCELSKSILYKACKKLTDIPNLLLINYDASKLEDVFSKGEIDKIYLNFSDPWPKSRHEKRRLTSDEFLKVYENILKDNSEIEFKTDNRGLFEYSVISLNKQGYDFLEISFDLHNSNKEDIVTTEYEDRFSNQGNVIYYIKVKVNK